VASVRTPIRFRNAELALTRAAPALGEHTAEILAALDRAAGSAETE
jgi:crotonobetainyl-CoA:carnitine CoA-transferase CaiB-like acyl-CoA transferase